MIPEHIVFNYHLWSIIIIAKAPLNKFQTLIGTNGKEKLQPKVWSKKLKIIMKILFQNDMMFKKWLIH